MEMLSQIQVGASEAFSLISFFSHTHTLFRQCTSRLREEKKAAQMRQRGREKEGELQ